MTLFGVEVVGSTDTEVSFSPLRPATRPAGNNLTYTAAGLPPGLSINSSTGVISGTTPSTPETFSVTVKAEDTTGASGSATFAWNVFPKLTIINPGPGLGHRYRGQPADRRKAPANPPPGTSLAYWAPGCRRGFRSTVPPASPISGTTPSTAGKFTVTVSVAAALSVSATFNWVVHNIVAVTNPGSQTSVIGAAVSLQIKASEVAHPRTLSYSGGVFPSGLSLDSSTGLISGIQGIFSDGAAGSSRSRCRPKTPQARPGQRRSSGSCSPMWGVTQPRNQAPPPWDRRQPADQGQPGPDLWRPAVPANPGLCRGRAAAGLSINSTTGLISGTPSKAGEFFAVTITAEDTTGSSGSAAFTWIVRNVVTVTNPGTQDSTVEGAVSLQIAASDSASGQTLTYTALNLPPGLSINRSTGLISGTIPTSTVVSTPLTVEVTAEDATGGSGSAAFGWIVRNRVMVPHPGTQTSDADTPVSLQIQASDSMPGRP